ncbi:CFA/I fimbrial chaperone [Klebsiella michiganensis]|uniref:CFA/I fimbrial chaperone n=1 Tax=Klebsiella michiganensis TaxID=1134687 RepID=A0A7H4N6J7_9ENTR|nr:CFA/I fimbrial chaperone [Klebsiella michiganensis]
MFRRRGVTLTNLLRMLICLLSLGFATAAQAISVGNLTFSLAAEDNFASKRVINNNKSARLYRVSIVAIDRPGGKEVRSRPADGELAVCPASAYPAGGGERVF